MDNSSLLVAAAVHDLAESLRHGEWVVELDKLPISTPDQEERAAKTKWHDEHPLINYIPQAYRLLHDTALQIDSLR